MPGTMPHARRPLEPYSKVTSTGHPLGKPGGKIADYGPADGMYSPGSELSPSRTLMAIERCPSDLVTNRSVYRAGRDVLRGISTTFFLRSVSCRCLRRPGCGS